MKTRRDLSHFPFIKGMLECYSVNTSSLLLRTLQVLIVSGILLLVGCDSGSSSTSGSSTSGASSASSSSGSCVRTAAAATTPACAVSRRWQWTSRCRRLI